MQQQLIKLSLLKTNSGQIEGLPKNPRLIKDEKYSKLVKSLKDDPEMLELRELIVFPFGKDFVVIGGNMRLKAMQELGYKEAPCKVLNKDISVEKLKAYTIKDNIGFGEHDWSLIANEWDAEQLNEWGLDIPDFATELEAEEDDFDVPEGGIETDIVLGDLFEIGQHRLLCGDSTDSDAVAKLMNGQKADIAFQSPPYNAGNNKLGGNKNKVDSKYENDNDDDIDKWFELVTASSTNAVSNSVFAFINVQQLANNKFKFIDFLHHVKEWFVDEMIWYKGEGNPALAPSVLNSRYEKILILKNEKFPSRAINVVKFRGTISNVYQGPSQTKNEFSKVHAATFPIHLPSFFINNFTIQSVMDLFGGTGTTMVAAHQLGRKAYLQELEPKYCQVIVDRMLKLDPTIEIKLNGKQYIKKDVNSEVTANA